MLHTGLQMIKHNEIDAATLHQLIRRKKIVLGGHLQLKTYGSLSCLSGKRMKDNNRVFFQSEQEAILLGYRPCGHCMRSAYKKWKYEFI